MDTQDPPTDPAVSFTRGLIGLDNEKRCYDITLSRQEGSTTHHLESAQVLRTDLPVETQDVFFWRLAGRSAPTG